MTHTNTSFNDIAKVSTAMPKLVTGTVLNYSPTHPWRGISPSNLERLVHRSKPAENCEGRSHTEKPHPVMPTFRYASVTAKA